MKWFYILLLLFSFLNADLEKYIFEKNNDFSWEELEKKDDVYKLAFTSQVWQQKKWYHNLYVVLPQGGTEKTTALLWVAGSGDAKTEINYAKKIAKQSGCAIFILMAVPNQPMFNGLWEDDLLSYSMEQTIKKQNLDSLILLPMVKSAIEGMNVAEDFSQKLSMKIDSFIVTGASKRGWVTWLTALDSRVKAIVPIVFDLLNLPLQVPNYNNMWGEYGEFVKEYKKRNVFDNLKTDAGKIITSAVDPYTYRGRITIPKFIILATNDRFTPLNALNLYYRDLPGKTYVCYVPNNRHRIKSTSKIANILTAVLLYSNGGEELPEFSWNFEDKKKNVKIPLKTKGNLKKVNIWHTDSLDLDFREASWKSFELPSFIKSATVAIRPGAHRAIFVEAIFKYAQGEVSFTSTVFISR